MTRASEPAAPARDAAVRSPAARARAVRVALVHDWLNGMRGGERCLEVFADLLPAAPILTLFHEPGTVSERIERHPIHASPLSASRFLRRRYRRLLPLFPWAVRTLPSAAFDVVVSLSHCAAKAVRVSPGARHVCYCFTPARYLWDLSDTYLARARPITRLAARMFRPWLQRWDRRTAAGVHRFVAISHCVAQRIERIYGRHAEVIHPPVELSRFGIAPPQEIGEHYLMVTALAPYKGVDLALETFRSWPTRRLVVIGSGEEERRLRAGAPPNVSFMGWQSDAQVAHAMARCRAFLLPCEEDFGITPLEAMASGRPVVALGRGGATETVVPPSTATEASPATGLLFAEPTPSALRAALEECEARLTAWDPAALRRHAARFDVAVFRDRIAQVLAEEGALSG